MRISNIIAVAIWIACASLTACAALGWREVETCVRIVGADGGAAEAGAR